MQTSRITYIDALKGMAIILVVWGHILDKSLLDGTVPLYKWIYSFHMPLFIFLSGLFAYKGMEHITWQNTAAFIKKKAARILLPFITIGGLYSLLIENNPLAVYTGEKGGYWFLPALFYCMLLGLLQRALVSAYRGGVKLL